MTATSPKCTCISRPWFLGIAHPASDKNTVIITIGCPLHATATGAGPTVAKRVEAPQEPQND
jgi:hypothetical protein